MAGIIFPKNWKTITDEHPIFKAGGQRSRPDLAFQTVLQNLFCELNNKHQCSFGLGFSGGIDSSCLAMIMSQLKISFRAITLCPSRRHPDYQYAKLLADMLKFDHSTYLPSKAAVREAKKAMNSAGDEIYYLLIKAFKSQGISTVINGDGIDELAGGYAQHQWTQGKPRKYWFEYHWNRLTEEHLKPLNKAAEILGMNVVLPFLSTEVVELLTLIPINKRADDLARKKPMRTLARAIGIPEKIIDREKYGLCNALSARRI